jgi:uncharacterized protein YqeY
MSLNVCELKEKLNEARKSGDKEKINVLKIIIGECDRHDRPDVESVVKKIVANNNLTIGLIKERSADDTTSIRALLDENDLLASFLPFYLSEQEIHNHVSSLELGTHLGKAIGIAMKHFKSLDLPVESSAVRSVVESKFHS